MNLLCIYNPNYINHDYINCDYINKALFNTPEMILKALDCGSELGIMFCDRMRCQNEFDQKLIETACVMCIVSGASPDSRK